MEPRLNPVTPLARAPPGHRLRLPVLATLLLLLAQASSVGAVDPDDPSNGGQYNQNSTPMPQAPNPRDGTTGEPVLGPLTWYAQGTAKTRFVVDLTKTKPTGERICSPETATCNRLCAAQEAMACDREARGTLAPYTKYYWQVTSLDGKTAQPGPLWTFTTGSGSNSLPIAGYPEPPSPSSGQAIIGALTWWAEGTEATQYVVDLGITNPPNPEKDRICKAQKAMSCERSNLGELDFGTTYYWRVTAIDGVGARPSPVWQFTTGGTGQNLPTPYNPTPGRTTSGQATMGLLTWSSDGNANTRYVVDLATRTPLDGNTDRICQTQKHKSCERSALGALKLDTTYYWQVTPLDFISAKPGPVWQFTTGATTSSLPMASSPTPTDGDPDEPSTGPLTWSGTGTSVTQWVVDLSKFPPTTGRICDAQSEVCERICHAQTERSCAREANGVLDPGTKYYWQATSIDGTGAQAGPIWSFTTGGTSLPEPYNPNPMHGTTQQQTTGPLTWSANGNDKTRFVVDLTKTKPTGERICSPETATCNRICAARSETSCNRSTVTPLDPYTKYYWQVTSIDGIGANAGPIWEFTTGGNSLPFATAPQPEDGATDEATTGPLTWWAQGTADTQYVVDLSETPPNEASDRLCEAGAASCNRLCAAQTALSCERSARGILETGTLYHWQVTSIDGRGAQPGPIWKFWTAGGSSSDVDSDGDGLTDQQETDTYGTDPTRPDSDGDGLTDGDEVLRYRISPTSQDSDGDSLRDGDEVTGALNAAHTAKHQTRGTYSFGLDRCTSENAHRCANPGATDPGIADSDRDGLSDGNEVLGVYKSSYCSSGPYCDRWFLNPNQADTDGDNPPGSTRFLDNSERARMTYLTNSYGLPYDPSNFDPDGDFLPDAREYELATDPFNWDTDHDLAGDGAEALEGGFGSDPRKANTDADSLPDLYDPELHFDNDAPFLLGWTTLENDSRKGLCLAVADQSDVIASKVARKIVTEVWRDGGVGPTLHRREEAWDNSTVVTRWDDTQSPPMMCLDYRLPTSFFGSDQHISRVEVTLQDAGANPLRLGFDLSKTRPDISGWQFLEQVVCWVPFAGSGVSIAKAAYQDQYLQGAWGVIELEETMVETSRVHGKPVPGPMKVIKAVGNVLCLIEHAQFLGSFEANTRYEASMQVQTNPEHVDTFLLKGGQLGKASIKVAGFEAHATLTGGGKTLQAWRGDGYTYLLAKFADRGWTQAQWQGKLQSAFTYGTFGSECAGTSVCYTVVDYQQGGFAWKVYILKGAIVDVHLRPL